VDRLPSNEFTMTQELIANMLGVRREGVTEAAGKLQAAGVINYSQDHRARPCETGSAGLRVLCGGQTRIRPLAFPRHNPSLSCREALLIRQ
jgi:Crp-like helix-turn-helix domain